MNSNEKALKEGVSTFEALCRFRDLLSRRERSNATCHDRRISHICVQMADELIDLRRSTVSVPLEGAVN